MSKENFLTMVQEGHQYKRDSFILGGAMLDGTVVPGAQVKIPLKTLNRHGLIAGATGTGKTKTLQVIAEQLSMKGIPSLLMDLKGDLSGLAQPGAVNDHIVWRHGEIGTDYVPEPMPVELLSLSEEKGVKLRATVSEFGPILFSKILGLNETQEGVMAIIFQYCDDNNMPLVDLKDVKEVMKFISSDGKKEIAENYGYISPASVGAISRKVLQLEQQGADLFFGERSFDPQDLIRRKDGKGMISVLRLTDIQDRPKLFSTFMLCLLAEIYSTFPEQGDSNQPKLCIFIDEAHLVFKEASDALMEQIEAIVKLIRSKGVGLYFCTQNPTDIPDVVLSQLGLKVQHALRAFTAKDRKAIKKTAENYPSSEFYDTSEVLTKLGIGEALITALNEKGIPTPLCATLLNAPKTRMDVLAKAEINDLVKNSDLSSKYNEVMDRESAYELLKAKMDKAREEEHKTEMEKQKAEAKDASTATRSRKKKAEPSFFEKASKNT
ncbi:MAG: helicase HerA-like domain-containing protein, partial [Bacteroidota bacterium]